MITLTAFFNLIREAKDFPKKAFKEKFHLGEEEGIDQHLLVKTIPPNNNMILTDKGVCFSYTPYEIGPYALGQITLFIPFTALKDILK